MRYQVKNKSRIVLYRFDIDYYSKEYDNKACSTSTPIYNRYQGIKAYNQSITEKCIDDNNINARCCLYSQRTLKPLICNYNWTF